MKRAAISPWWSAVFEAFTLKYYPLETVERTANMAEWMFYFAPCEALASRDPGRAP